MATLVWTNASFWLNGVDLSGYTESLTLNYSTEVLDKTAMGATARAKHAGFKNWSVDAVFHQDFAAGAVDATLFSLVGTTACFAIRPVNACSTATNPEYWGIGMVSNYTPMSGAIGTLLNTPFKLESAGSLNRASSS